jgi:hypothetical protein
MPLRPKEVITLNLLGQENNDYAALICCYAALIRPIDMIAGN